MKVRKMRKRTFTSHKAAGLALSIGALLAAAPAAEASTTLLGITPKGELGDGFDNPQVMPVISPGVALDGNSFAVDFNPVPDAIRILSNTDQNLRVSPSTGDLVAEDGDINGAPAQIVDGAYTNSKQSVVVPATAVLYVLDAKDDKIYTQNPPNDGTLTNPVDLNLDLQKKSGFDLVGAGNKGFIVNTNGDTTKLFKVKRESQLGLDGDTKRLGKVGAKLTSLAVDQPKAN